MSKRRHFVLRCLLAFARHSRNLADRINKHFRKFSLVWFSVLLVSSSVSADFKKMFNADSSDLLLSLIKQVQSITRMMQVQNYFKSTYITSKVPILCQIFVALFVFIFFSVYFVDPIKLCKPDNSNIS
jgi:hypothetical protein